MTETRRCFYCKEPAGAGPKEVRPYGPGGAWVCAECVLGNPNRESIAKKQLQKRLDACGPVAVLTPDGFKPAAEVFSNKNGAKIDD